MSAAIRIITAVACGILLATPARRAFAQTEPDMYERYAQLAESLREWSARGIPHAMIPESEKALTDVLPRSVLRTYSSLSRVSILLPEYLGVVRSSVSLPLKGFDSSTASGDWSVPLKTKDGHLLLDDIPVTGGESVASFRPIVEHLRCRLGMLRTLALPASWRIHCAAQLDSAVQVKLAGPNLSTYRLRGSTWMDALRRLAWTHLVYAGISGIESDKEQVRLHLYVLITDLGADRHHFIEWIETIRCGANRCTTIGTEATIMAFVRTDNLLDLFVRPRSGE